MGKTTDTHIQALTEEYLNKIQRYAQIEMQYLTPKYPSNDSKAIKQLDEKAVEKSLAKVKNYILLDEKGKTLSSQEFANKMDNWAINGISDLTFVIGGAFGFSESLKSQALMTMSMSKMTFTHQMIRPFLTEQIYRAFTIINNFPYHNE